MPSYPAVPRYSAPDAQLFRQILVFVFGFSIFGFFSLALGAFCISVRRTQDSSHLHTSPPSEVSPIVPSLGIDRVAEARRNFEADQHNIVQELLVKIENLEGQIVAKASEIKFLKFHHECQLASFWSDFESQKAQSTTVYRALEVDRQNTVADLHARIAELEKQADNHAASIEQVTAAHKRELEGARSKHRSAIQTLTSLHEAKTTNLAKELVDAQVLATRLDTELHRTLKDNEKLQSSKVRLTESESSQSTTIFELKAQLEVVSAKLQDELKEKASVRNRLAAAEKEVESISTRLYDAVREHTVVVRLKDDMIKKNSEAMNASESELIQQRDKAAQLASQIQVLDAEITAKNTESMTIPSQTSSPRSLRRRHSLDVINEKAKQTLEEITATVAATENLEVVAAEEAAVEEALFQDAGPDFAEPSHPSASESVPVEPPLQEQGLSASMWASSARPIKHELPPKPNFEPQVDWAAEAARRKGYHGGNSYQTALEMRNVEQQRPRWGADRQGFTTFNTAQRVALGKADGIKVTKKSKKDVRHISRESDYKFHDYR
ncbi:hypothetical protein FRC01_012001 [Tulasnella sp. 417]|nr:hypothetical protein FRC01_012001 [Tulasnella sp. 417]